MKVGILINNAAQFINGSEQQPQFVFEMLEHLGVEFEVFSHIGREKTSGIQRSKKFYSYDLTLIDTANVASIDVFIMICHIVEDGTALNDDLRARLRGKKVVQFHCGNHAMFNVEDIVFAKHNVVRLLYNTWFTETWHFSMHAFAAEYYELLTGKPSKLMPYPWSPTLLCRYMEEKKLTIRCEPRRYSGKLTLCCFEPNLNVTKNCTCPLLIMNEFYKRHPERVEKCFLFCTRTILHDKNPGFVDYLRFLDIVTDKKVEFYPRVQFPDIMQQMVDRQMAPVIIGHQMLNDQNYLSLEALYLGYPLIHNSDSIRTAGEYYPEWRVKTGVERLEHVAEHFATDEYQAVYDRRSKRVLDDHAPSNPRLLSELRALLCAKPDDVSKPSGMSSGVSSGVSSAPPHRVYTEENSRALQTVPKSLEVFLKDDNDCLDGGSSKDRGEVLASPSSSNSSHFPIIMG